MLVLLFANEPISLTHLSEILFIAKSTAKKDFDLVEDEFKELNVELTVNRKGHLILCSEPRRRLLIQYVCMYYLVDYRYIQTVFTMISEYAFCLKFEDIKHCMIQVLIDYSLHVPDTAIQSFLIFVETTYIRNQQGYVLPFLKHITSPVIADLKKVWESLFSISNDEWHYIEQEFHNRTLQKLLDEDEEQGTRIVSDFLSMCDNEYALRFDDEDYKYLLKHVSKIIMKSREKIIERNKHTDSIIMEYPYAFEISLNLNFLLHASNIYVPIDDIALIALFINGIQQRELREIHVLLVSGYGDLFLENIKNGLKNTIPYKNLTIDVAYEYEFYEGNAEQLQQYDIIVATDNKMRYITQPYDIPYVKINPLYRGDDAECINHALFLGLKKRQSFEKQRALTRKLITLEVIIEKDSDVLKQQFIRHIFVAKEGLLIVRSSRCENYIRCNVLKEIFNYQGHSISVILEYASNHREKDGCFDVYMLFQHIIKHVSLTHLKMVRNKNDFLSIITESLT